MGGERGVDLLCQSMLKQILALCCMSFAHGKDLLHGRRTWSSFHWSLVTLLSQAIWLGEYLKSEDILFKDIWGYMEDNVQFTVQEGEQVFRGQTYLWAILASS